METLSERAIRHRLRRKQRLQRRILRVTLGTALVLGLIFLALHMINSRSAPSASGVSDDNVAVHF
jgi:hypothetical protein